MPKITNDGLRKRCGCPKRNWPKCGHPWHVNFHHDGKEHRFSLDTIAKARNEPRPVSKADALKWRDKLRNEIRDGAFAKAPAAAAAASALLFSDVVKAYRTRYVNVPTRRPSAAAMFEIHLNMLLRATVPGADDTTTALKDKPIHGITKADVEAIRDARRQELAAKAFRVRRPGAKGGEVGINRLLARLRHVFTWAIAEGYVDSTPFKRQGVTVVKLEHRAETSRQRRLVPGEEARLLEQAGAHLRAIIVAALHTGCRLGELLSLTWAQVQRDPKGVAVALVLPAGRTKTNQARVIPIGPRLRAELEMRRQDPAGADHPATAYVFGNEVGEEVTSIREAWAEACTAAGITDLHFHDLRREFACRLLESSADLHDVRDFLGHANITTTSTYLASTPVRLAKALSRLDPEPAPEATAPDSHAVHTNEAEDTNGRSGGPAVTH